MDIENLSLTIKIIMGIFGVIFILISLADVATGFWLFVIPAIIIGIIFYNIRPTEQTILPVVAIVGSAAAGWFCGSILSVLCNLIIAVDKLENKAKKWLDE